MALMLFATSCSNDSDRGQKSVLPETSEVITKDGLALKVYDFDALAPLFQQDDGYTYIINFWASWCKPCIQEMPYFEQAGKDFKDMKVRIIMVSLDFRSQAESNLIPYLQENDIKNTVVLLDDPDANDWIPKVDETWTGAIPATLIYNGDQREFHEASFTSEELYSLINKFI
jgi:thiol-disulfide isomerase/thioredoxin